MLDLKVIRDNPELVKTAIKNRGLNLDIQEILDLDTKRRKSLTELETLKAERNAISKKGKPESATLDKMKILSQKIDCLEEKVDEINEKLRILLLNIPNIPHNSVPIGNVDANKIIKSWGKIPEFDFNPKDHIELGTNLDILDFPRSSKITGAGFCLFKGFGALLERALINFMLDFHTTKHRYKEIFPPFLVNRSSMIGTGQLPKLEEDMYRLKDDDLFLIPTAEVPVTNLHRDEILEEADLPIYYTAYTACFRREAGSYGKDTKGLTRVHQFDKVELVKFVRPDTSFDELETLLQDAEEVLQKLGLHYRVVVLSTGDISFAASKCYDIEAWAPGIGRYLEVSSCSNFTDFQARRANIRYRTRDKKIEYVHTLNGSGIAMPRTVIALLETYQEKDGSILIPEVLRPYMGGREKITRK